MPDILLDPDGQVLMFVSCMIIGVLAMAIRGKRFMAAPQGPHARRSNWIAVLVFGTLAALFMFADWSPLR